LRRKDEGESGPAWEPRLGANVKPPGNGEGDSAPTSKKEVTGHHIVWPLSYGS